MFNFIMFKYIRKKELIKSDSAWEYVLLDDYYK